MRIMCCAAAVFAPLVAIASVGTAFVVAAVLGWHCGDAVGYDRSTAQTPAMIFGTVLWFFLLFWSLAVLYRELAASLWVARCAITLLVVPTFVAAALTVVASIGLWGCGLGGLVGDQWWLLWAPSFAAFIMLLIGSAAGLYCGYGLLRTTDTCFACQDEKECLRA